MARGTQLQTLVTMLRAEAGHSTSVSSGIDNLPGMQTIIRRVQEVLYQDFDWPFLRIKPFIDLSAGDRYYDMPAEAGFEMDMERIDAVYCWYNDRPLKVTRGINPEQMRTYNSENDDRSGPVLRWDTTFTGTNAQIEVWPIPVDDNQQLQFVGIRQLGPLIENSDTADLDDQLIVLTAAAEYLADAESEKAPLVQRKAQAYYEKLRGRTQGGSSPMILDGLGSRREQYRGKSIIRISS